MKGTAERRINLLVTLCKRRHDTADNLAFEFGVSERTIRNDIDVLSVNFPVYTVCGRGGGIYLSDTYQLGMQYLTEKERKLLEEIVSAMDEAQKPVMEGIIRKFTKPGGNG